MRKNNTQQLNEVIEEYLEALKISGKIKEVKLIRSWQDVVGKTIARSTEKIFIKNKTLYIYLNSSIVRNELMMLKEGLIKALNDKAGDIIIQNIVMK